MKLFRFLQRRPQSIPADLVVVTLPVRGKVHRVSTLTGGDKSVVLRFGLEEADRAKFRPGMVLEVRVVEAPPMPEPGKIVDLSPDQNPPRTLEQLQRASVSPCNCGATAGHPHEPDCAWWEELDTARRKRMGLAEPADTGAVDTEGKS